LPALSFALALLEGSLWSIRADTLRVVELPATSKTVLEATVGWVALVDSSEAVSVKFASALSAKPDLPSEAVNCSESGLSSPRLVNNGEKKGRSYYILVQGRTSSVRSSWLSSRSLAS
jgi:hypothetical protein